MIDKFEADTAIRRLFGMMNPPRIEALVAFVMQVQGDAAQPDALIRRICDAVRAADSKSVDEADYMFDSEDCIKIIEAFSAPAAQAASDNLVTMTIAVDRNGAVTSDVQTHDNSYSEVAIGLSAARDEINRVFAERKKCPHYPANSEAAKQKIVRSGGEVVAPRVNEQEKKRSDRIEDGRFEQARNDARHGVLR